MKRFTLCFLVGFAGLMLVPHIGYSQTQSSDQSMNELLKEVRLLREDLRRLTTSTYRAHAMIERLKLQQDQVNRMNNDLIAVRNELAATRNGRTQLKEKIVLTQQRIDNGTAPPTDLNGLKSMLSDMEQREPDLIVKESQLSGQLNIERGTLDELQKRLDAIDSELQSLTRDEKRPKEKP